MRFARKGVTFADGPRDAQLFCRYRQRSRVTDPSRRQFWLALLWLGLVQTADWALAILEIGVWPGNVAALAGSALLAAVATIGVLWPTLLGGPTERNGGWWGAVAAAVLATLVFLL